MEPLTSSSSGSAYIPAGSEFIPIGTGSFSINQVPSDPIVIRNTTNSELIFKITSDGEIVVGDGYTPSEAGDEFIKQMQVKLATKDQEYIEQLEAAIEAWKENLNDY
jgi:hypothetical protein